MSMERQEVMEFARLNDEPMPVAQPIQEEAEEKNEENTAGGKKERAKYRGIDTDIFGYPKAKSIIVSERKTDIFGYPISKSVLPKSFVEVSRAKKLKEPDQEMIDVEANKHFKFYKKWQEVQEMQEQYLQLSE